MARLTPEQKVHAEKQAERCRLIVKQLVEATGIEFTFGYIGNLDAWGNDDRCWSAFAPHPGRVGNEGDRIGGYYTEDLDKLVPYLAGALRLARIQSRTS
jgi:hypothetical protein